MVPDLYVGHDRCAYFVFRVWKRVRRGCHRFGEVAAKRAELFNRISSSNGSNGVGARDAHGVSEASSEQVETRTGGV